MEMHFCWKLSQNHEMGTHFAIRGREVEKNGNFSNYLWSTNGIFTRSRKSLAAKQTISMKIFFSVFLSTKTFVLHFS